VLLREQTVTKELQIRLDPDPRQQDTLFVAHKAACARLVIVKHEEAERQGDTRSSTRGGDTTLMLKKRYKEKQS